MLKSKNPHKRIITFPTLNCIRTDDFRGKKTKIYKCDWTIKENEDIESHNKWVSNNPESSSYILSLPKKYDDLAKSLEFAIPPNYMKEINRCATCAIKEYYINN